MACVQVHCTAEQDRHSFKTALTQWKRLAVFSYHGVAQPFTQRGTTHSLLVLIHCHEPWDCQDNPPRNAIF
ncbi:hypothetical protein SCLCIDRAFT_596994 [Scleroderma citrinum Foug A]|uniref:Uncharacterized protein n=1 Tax=Scleroderma citrinum Foug A TaxID=1036808 RepID=A0A0C2ZTJ0_9AGAM|nr:hypothetical protein SCLCIDRAFT_596994 [Scleroderma citrinum Foug A]